MHLSLFSQATRRSALPKISKANFANPTRLVRFLVAAGNPAKATKPFATKQSCAASLRWNANASKATRRFCNGARI